MTPVEVAFFRRLLDKRPSELRAEGVAARMAALHGLGKVRGSRIVYSEKDLAAAASMLENRRHDLQAPREPFTRSQAPAGGSEKAGSQSVLHETVAIVSMGIPSIESPPGGFIGMPWRDALALPYQVLLVCENLEPLMLLPQAYPWLLPFIKGRATLALFRGKPGVFRVDAAAHLIAADQRPTLAFFDFDPKGLSMAASLPRREALCLPPWPELKERTLHLNRVNLFVQSLDASRAHLDRVADPDILRAWQRLKALAKGLDQEGMIFSMHPG